MFLKIFFYRYSEASKKCSNEGRALMLLDFDLLCRELETITALKPLPHKNFLNNYIKAFYLPPGNLDEWIVHHTVRIKLKEYFHFFSVFSY